VTITSHERWHAGLWAMTPWREALTWDYKTDWSVSVMYRPWDAPFWGGVLAGPRYIGLGLGLSF
jgi:hypothetical protein